MPVCAICEKVVDKVYRCAKCGINFCKDCGDPRNSLCAICMSYEAEEEEWPEEEEEEWEEEEWEEEEW